jgi:hypothetical protein
MSYLTMSISLKNIQQYFWQSLRMLHICYRNTDHVRGNILHRNSHIVFLKFLLDLLKGDSLAGSLVWDDSIRWRLNVAMWMWYMMNTFMLYFWSCCWRWFFRCFSLQRTHYLLIYINKYWILFFQREKVS